MVNNVYVCIWLLVYMHTCVAVPTKSPCISSSIVRPHAHTSLIIIMCCLSNNHLYINMLYPCTFIWSVFKWLSSQRTNMLFPWRVTTCGPIDNVCHMDWKRPYYLHSDVVLYHMRILYHTRMVHTICVYAYGTTIRVRYNHTRMVRKIVPSEYS